MKRLCTIIALSFLTAPLFAQGGGSIETISYQGYLQDDQGQPLTGSVKLTFKLYNGITSGLEWTEIHPAVNVTDGVFHIDLGSITPFTTNFLRFDRPMNLGIAVGNDPELSPRTPLTSVPYAMNLRGWLRVQPLSAARDNPFDSANIIGGNGYVESNVVGATIGGGGNDDDSDKNNRIDSDYGTIGGGFGNRIEDFDSPDPTALEYGSIGGGRRNSIEKGPFGTIGGGYLNKILAASISVKGDYGTISGGRENQVLGPNGTVGGGYQNQATESGSTVGGGFSNIASGQYSFVGGGGLNVASGQYGVVAGGLRNEATSVISFAAGYRARANHVATFVWSDRSKTSETDADNFVSTANNQFLVRAAGGVGIGTNSPTAAFHLQAAKDAAASLSGHIALLENNAATTGNGPDVLAIKTSASNPTGATNLITFYDATKAIGRIEGDGAGGIAFNSGGADYAEYLPLEPGASMPEPGTVVGVRGGVVSSSTSGAERLMVVSTRPIVVGNRPQDGLDRHVVVAFVGQVPVRVAGPAASGDFLVASGAGDGRARAITPGQLTLECAGQVFGRVWRTSEDAAEVIAEVGLDRSDVLVEIARNQEQRIRELAAVIARLEGSMTELRARNSEFEKQLGILSAAIGAQGSDRVASR